VTAQSQLEDGELRLRVRQLLLMGRLPLVPPIEVAAGYGHDDLCAACERSITANEMEYEFVDRTTGRRLSVHSRCYTVWQSERAQLCSSAAK
jgi:hypothetical protein